MHRCSGVIFHQLARSLQRSLDTTERRAGRGMEAQEVSSSGEEGGAERRRKFLLLEKMGDIRGDGERRESDRSAPPRLHLASTSPPPRLHLASTSSPPRLHLASTSSPPRLHLAYTSPPLWTPAHRLTPNIWATIFTSASTGILLFLFLLAPFDSAQTLPTWNSSGT